MNPSDTLNKTLAMHHPSAHSSLSDLGRRLFFPVGIPAQAAQAKSCSINATLGQLTDDNGHAMPLTAMSTLVSGLNEDETFLYAAQGGDKKLREAWAKRLSENDDSEMSLPIVTCGLTHGLSMAADMFTDEDTTVILPNPGWGNYKAIFQTRRGAKLRYYNVLKDGAFDLDSLKGALESTSGKRLLLINMPSNPIGYSASTQEAQNIANVIMDTKGHLVVLTDDAYLGMTWEDGLQVESIFHLLKDADPERILSIKIDGATKELFFFGGRVGFMTFRSPSQGAAALEEKCKALARATISSVAAPSQRMVLAALNDRNSIVERDAILTKVKGRYLALKAELSAASLDAWPFNSAFFALINVGSDPEAVRLRLLERGVGVVSFESVGAIRVSYASTPESRIPELVKAIAESIHS